MLRVNESEEERFQRKVNSMPLLTEPVETPFYIFAIRMNTADGEIRRMLVKDKLYYLLKGFEILEDKIIVDASRFNRPVFDFYIGADNTKPHVSVSAIVGENGAGKSSLIEFEIRLINNLAAAVFGEYSKEPGWEHLHYINGLYGEMYFMADNAIYKLNVEGRHVCFSAFKQYSQKGDGSWGFDTSKDAEEIIVDEIEDDKKTPFKGYESKRKIKEILSQFFYTVVLNQSVYAYNTNDYSHECNSETYEIKLRKKRNTDKDGKRIPYTVEDKCWLNGLFHKNDGYQIPIVLSPYRLEGNFDINRENELAYERLINLLIHSEDSFRVINSHLWVNCFVLKKKNNNYDIHYVHSKLGFKQFGDADFEEMKDALIRTWVSTLNLNGMPIRTGVYTALAKNYLVYKTLKVAATYDEYNDFRKKYLVEGNKFDEKDFCLLVQKSILNRSHVSNKLYRAFAHLLWDIYDVGGGRFRIKLDEVRNRWAKAKPNKVLNKQYGTASLVLQAALPPPFFEMSIEALELNTREVVPFETLSSGEKQQAYTISSILYHLNNLESVKSDLSTEERIEYQRIHLVLEEVELYFHPQLQKEFVKNLLDGIKQMNFSNITWIDIRIVTHSPFVLSDIPTGNVLTLRKSSHDIERIYCFGANIHEMLRNTFFLKNGTVGDFSAWLIKRIAQCLHVHRWMCKSEKAPDFFPTLKGDIPDDYLFLEEFKQLLEGNEFNKNAFDEVYGQEKLLRLVSMIEEPVVRRVLMDDYHRTFPKDVENYKNYLNKMIRGLEERRDSLIKYSYVEIGF